MERMINGAKACNQPLEGGSVGHGTDVRYMIYGATSLARAPAWYKQG